MNDDFDLILSFLLTAHATPDEQGADPLVEWLEARGLVKEGEAVAAEDVRRMVRLRVGLRDLVAEASGAAADPRTRPFLNEVAKTANLHVAFQDDGTLGLAAPGAGADRATGELLAAFYRLDVRGELVRLKTCRACGWPYLDRSKNRSRVWCEMATCGSQEKAKSYRRRKAGTAPH